MSTDERNERDVLFHYVLNGLTASERARLEARLGEDPDLRVQLEEVRRTTDVMAFAAVAEPPAGLRDSVMAAAAARDDALLEYALASTQRREKLAESEEFDPAMAESLVAAADKMAYATVTQPPPNLRSKILAAASDAQTKAPQAPVSVAPSKQSGTPWTAIAAAAASIVAVIFGWQSMQLRDQLGIEQQVARLMLEPNTVQTYTLGGKAAGAARGRVTLDMDGQKGAVVVRGVPATERGEVYRLWARVAGTDVFCGEFAAPQEGAAEALFKVPTDSYTAPVDFMFLTKAKRGSPKVPQGPRYLQSV